MFEVVVGAGGDFQVACAEVAGPLFVMRSGVACCVDASVSRRQMPAAWSIMFKS